MSGVLLSGWFLHPALRAALLGGIEAQPERLEGWALQGKGAFVPPVLAPGAGGAGALRLMPRAEDAALLDWLAAGLGEMRLADGTRVIGAAPAEGGETPDWRAEWSAADAALIAAALAEFAPQWQDWAPRFARPHLFAALARGSTARYAARQPTPSRPGTPACGDVILHERQTPLRGFFAVQQINLQVPRFDGHLGPRLDRTIWHTVDAALVLPYDPATDRILLIEQFRFGPFIRGDAQPWKLEPPAGLIDPGESPEEAARREMQEETGLAPERLIPAGGGYASPGYATDHFAFFIGICALPEAGGWVSGLAGEGENIRSHILPLEAALEMVDRGEIDVVPLVTLLLWLARHRAGLAAL